MIRILLVEDHVLIREGVRRVLAPCADMQVVAECHAGDQVHAHLAQERCDVLLVGLRLLVDLPEMPPGLPVVVLGDACGEGTKQEALRAGAAGYLCKDCPVDEMVRVLRAVHAGEPCVCRTTHGGEVAAERLSTREMQVLLRLADGEALDAIARGLDLSPSTVKTYRQRLLGKLGARDNAALVRFAVRRGLVN